MDFLEGLFENFRRKRHRGGSHHGDHHGHGRNHDDHHDHDQYEDRHSFQPNNALVSCPKCSEKIPSSYRFCPNCGSPAKKSLLCSSCKKEIPPQSKFCPSCGDRVVQLFIRLREITKLEVFLGAKEKGGISSSGLGFWETAPCKWLR
jgi:RNA polymerase subunit RPABC4/transcription elongation factor Spt4